MSIKSNQFKYSWFCNLKRGLSISGFAFIVTGSFYVYFLSISSFSFFVQNQKIADSKQPKYVTKNYSLFIPIFCFSVNSKEVKKSNQLTIRFFVLFCLDSSRRLISHIKKKEENWKKIRERERESLRSAFFLVEKFSLVSSVSPLTACVLFSWKVHAEHSGLELLRSRKGKRELNLFQSIWLGWKLDCQSNFWKS
jgi:hypothetical protein